MGTNDQMLNGATESGLPIESLPVELEYFISLDLGSESMAACFQHRDAQRPVTIDLQARAKELRQWKQGMAPIDLLYDEAPNGMRKPSHRLRTRISLRDHQQPSPLPKEHATLRFVNGNEGSIFNCFHLEGEALASDRLIPNPKLLFQTGITDVIPWVPGPEGWDVQYEPAELLAHLTVQVLNNLVLGSKELEGDARRRRLGGFDSRTAHLTITVPNVYSLTHVKQLEEFVLCHTEVGAVQTMYESDAIAHFMLGEPLPDDPPTVQDVKRRIAQALAQQRRDASSCRVLTIDIGKGTTDLSLFNYDLNHQANSFTHDVLGRTGRSHGGARLSYILVEHLDQQIRQTLADAEQDSSLSHLVKQAIGEKRSRVGLLEQPPKASSRGPLLDAAEKLVETYKRSLDAEYRLDPKIDLGPLVGRLAEVICQEIAAASSIAAILASTDPALGALTVASASPSDSDEIRKEMAWVRKRLEEALSFPDELPSPPSSGRREGKLFRRLLGRSATKPTSTAAVDPAFFQLRAKIDEYVRQNVEDPLNWLIGMAEQRERCDRRLRARAVDAENTFVIVAGQASRFAPIGQAIRARIGEKLGIDLESHLLFLPDQLAKLACCFGAQWYFRSSLSCNNPEEIMGTYAFLRRFAATHLENLDMAKFNQKGTSQDLDLLKGEYWLVFEPRAFDSSTVPLEDVDRDSMAFIRTFNFKLGGSVHVRYLGWGQSIEIAEHGKKFAPVKFEATFGNVGIDVDDIYRKTWPEALRHETK